MSSTTENPSLMELFIDDYLTECAGHLVAVGRAIDDLAPLPTDVAARRQTLSDLILHLHSLKGSASLIHAPQEERVARQLENYVRDVLQGRKTLTDAGRTSFEKGARLLSEILAARREKRAVPDVESIEAQLAAMPFE